ncbi:MAG TPA: dihydrodiol dehydrogenase [Chloroflexota bacterium]|nr:dihydrodiol dehydrogenase [Chloroflexota bacterium]
MTAADSGPDFELSNEFATVRVRRVSTRNGVRLEISSPRLGTSIQLDPVALESLTWQRMDLFSTFLRQPFGPED